MSLLILLLVSASSNTVSWAWVTNDSNRAQRYSRSGDTLHFTQQRLLTSCNNLRRHHDDPEAVAPVAGAFKESSSRISSQHEESSISRRHALQQTTAGILAVSSVVSCESLFPPAVAHAQEKNAGSATASAGLVSTEQVADLLHIIPTFTIVDRQGIPYMVVGEDAKITCYFFTTFAEARRLLDLARTSADKAIATARKEASNEKKKIDPADLVNPWKEARISTVPLDFAATLVTKSLSGSQSGSGGRSRARGLGGSYFQIAASQDDIQNALSLTGKETLAEGKVPLFYVEDFTTQAGGKNKEAETNKTPLYFSQGQLEQEYLRLSKSTKATADLPEIKVTELFSVLVEMVSGTDPELKNLMFVPPIDSKQRAKECIQKGGKEYPPFVLGQRNVIL